MSTDQIRWPGAILRGALVTVCALVVAVSTMGQTTWNGSQGSAWNLATNWSAGVPTAGVDAVIPAGTPNAPTTSGVVGATCRDVSVLAGATLTIASGFPLQVNRNATLTGAVAGGGTLRCVGATQGVVTGAGSKAIDVEVAKTGVTVLYADGALTFSGSLTVTSGGFRTFQGPNGVWSFGGAFLGTGGTLSLFNTGTLDIGGNVTFAGTVVNSVMPPIRCGGNWSADASFAPISSTVEFDGTSPQTVSGAGVLHTVVVDAGATIAGAPTLVVAGTLTVDGVLNGAVDLGSDLTVSATGTWNSGPSGSFLGGSLVLNGGFTGSGTLTFDGTSTAYITTTRTIPDVVVLKSGIGRVHANGAFTINGNLTVQSGGLYVSSNGQTVTVTGSAWLQGGVLAPWNVGTLDVAGDIVCSGTTCTGMAPNIRCGGNWTGDLHFAPTSAAVTFDGVVPQTISGTNVSFFGLTVQAGSVVSTATALTLAGPFTVNGTFSSTAPVAAFSANGAVTVAGILQTASPLDIRGDLTVSVGGSVIAPTGTHLFGGSLIWTGNLQAPGTFRFDGTTAGYITTTHTLPNVVVAKAGTGSLYANGNFSIAGNLLQLSGNFYVTNSIQTVTVNGDATFQGGTLLPWNIGTLDVQGNVTFAGGATTSTLPTIRCAGNFLVDASFAPTSGTIELDGVNPTTFGTTAPSGILRLPTFIVSHGVRRPLNDVTVDANTVTIAADGALDVTALRRFSVRRLQSVGTASFTVNGLLSVQAAGDLRLGGSIAVTVSTTGTLSMPGAPTAPASLSGEAGGGYALTINGTVSARNFIWREMDNAGVIIGTTATIAAAPNDLRGGTFDFRAGATTGAALFDIRRTAPANLRYLTFLNTPGIPSAYNVRTVSTSAPVSFTNWSGAFAGPSHELDPNNKIGWNAPEHTQLASFRVRSGAERAQIIWSTPSIVDVAAFIVERATSPAGPFTPIATFAPPGPDYGFADQPLVANQTYTYRLVQRLTHDVEEVLATASVTPYSSLPPANVYQVGGGGPYATIQAAVDAASSPMSVVRVMAGTYPAFSVGASGPADLRIMGVGAVLVNAAAEPVRIHDVAAPRTVEIANLSIVNASSTHAAIEVSTSSGTIVLDELAIQGAAAATGLHVVGATAVAVQKCAIAGAPGMRVEGGSTVVLSRGTVDELEVAAAQVERCDVTPASVSVTSGGAALVRPGLMPDLTLPGFATMGVPYTLGFHAFPNAPWTLAASTRTGFALLGAPFEMAFLLDPAGMVILPPLLTDPAGNSAIDFEIEPLGALLGVTLAVQAVAQDPVSGAVRFSNEATMVFMP